MPNLCIIPARALSDRTLTPRDLRALLAVGTYTNGDGKGCWASQSTLAERAGMSRTNMNACLRTLAAKGYIVKVRRTDPTTRKELTAWIDVVLDDPKLGTPPVPKLETPPVPTVGTQTTPYNDPTTTTTGDPLPQDTLPPDHRAAIRKAIDDHRNPTVLQAEFVKLAKEFSWPTLGKAVYDILVAGAPLSSRALRAFCLGVKAKPGPGRGKGPAVDFAALERNLKETTNAGITKAGNGAVAVGTPPPHTDVQR